MKHLRVTMGTTLAVALIFNGLLYLNQVQYNSQNNEQSWIFLKSIDNSLFDLLLRLKPAIPEDPKILLLEADDQTITEVNRYPLPREMFADGMILIAEFSPEWVMLDIEFVDRSEDGIDYEWKDTVIADQINNGINDLTDYQEQLVQLIDDGQITSNQALEYMEDLKQFGANVAKEIIASTDKITYSRDAYLGQALAYLGNVTATINMIDDKDNTIPEELRQWAEENVSINDYLILEDDPFDSANEILPAIDPVLKAAKWAGFPRSYIDQDGTRRRIDLIFRQNDKYYTNLGFGTWWVKAGKPPITVYPGRMEVGGLKIPLDKRGKILLNWPKRKFDGTPLNRKEATDYDATNPKHRLSFFYLYYHDRLLEDLSTFIAELEHYGIRSDVYGDTRVSLGTMEGDIEAMQQEMLTNGNGSRAPELGQYREEYLEAAQHFINGDAREIIQDELEGILGDPETSSEDYTYYTELMGTIDYLFSETNIILMDIQSYRNHLRDRLNGATIIAGYTGTSTTDYGVNPFERKYMNMGIYGVLYNSLLQGLFLKESPLWVSLIVSCLAGFAVILLTNISKKNSAINTVRGAIFILLAIVSGSVFFILTGTYLPMIPLILTLVTAYLGTLINNFLATSKEKAFIQDAFGQIISPDVVKEIQDNPNVLNMSGDNRSITAMFTDIESFSTISEHLGSSDKLFDFIKRYLTPMSNIILEELGTIDKYEGDAIIAFWNAPITQEDHPTRACRAAMRMVQLEKVINKELIEAGLLNKEILSRLPHGQIYTRIGINTGINNVGFIGTDKRKDYTALGDEMNLAARLEGVNKLYGTQVLISGSTESIIRNDFITRHLDKIRVIGKEKPIHCYELCYARDFAQDFTDIKQECFYVFHTALNFFYEQKWNDAEKLFRDIIVKLPNDGPSREFFNRCQMYKKNPPPKNWDGVHRMQTK